MSEAPREDAAASVEAVKRHLPFGNHTNQLRASVPLRYA